MAKNSARSERPLFYAASWAAIVVCIAAGAFAPNASNDAGVVILLASTLLFGLPHGACDLWVIGRARGENSLPLKIIIALALVYVGLAGAMFALWRTNAPAALVFFLLLAAWHFGSGDAAFWFGETGLRRGDDVDRANRQSRIAVSAGRGLLVIAAPLSFRAAECAPLLARFARVGGDSFDGGGWLAAAHSILLGGVFLQCAGLSNLAASKSQRIAFAVETLLLLMLFICAPPRLSVACYFIFVHSWRHLRRIEKYEIPTAANSLAETPPLFDFRRRGIAKQHWRGLPFTVLALLGIGFPLIISMRAAPIASLDWTVNYLMLLAVLTLPHTLVVGWLDWRNLH